MLNAIGAWKNANRLKNIKDEEMGFEYSAVTQE